MQMGIRHAVAALLVALASGSQAADDAGKLSAWDRFKAYAHQEKEAAVTEGRKLIAATDRHLDAMKQQAKDAKKETVAAHKANMAELETKKRAAQAHLDKMAQSTADAWDATKDGFANAYKDLHQAYEKSTAKQ